MEGRRRGWQPCDEPLAEVAAETGRVLGREADIFVEMEDGHPLPWDRRLGHEFREHLELRRPRGHDERDLPAIAHRVADRLGGICGNLSSEDGPVGMDGEFHATISFTTRCGSTPVSFWSRP